MIIRNIFLLITSCFIVKTSSFSPKEHLLQSRIRKSYKMFANPSKVVYDVGFKQNKLGTPWTYSELVENIKKHNVDSVSIVEKGKQIEGFVSIDHSHGETILPENLHPINSMVPEVSNKIIDTLTNNKINFDILDLPTNDFLNSLILPLEFAAVYLGVGLIINFLRGGGQFGGMMPPMMANEEKLLEYGKIETKFSDVAGCEEAKYELEEVVEFLKNPLKFKAAGAKIPKGALLDGPPGTGKTLLAKAVAGEAGVSFIAATGSEFIEMFVGVGASRVRKLFEKAQKNKPCVIFIDEIDAIGRQRGAGFNAGNDEREQTLNQILTNMDGFEASDGIIVLAATNRADILDSALTRSGRFDRKITVPLPDLDGRKEILDVHLRDKTVDDDIDYEEIASLTGGFSGADIANMANEAAIFSVRNNQTKINRKSMIDAFEKMVIGIPKKNRKIDVKADTLVAYHEAGHTITAELFDNFFNVRKVTIQANKGGAGGYTLFTPVEYYNSYPTKEFLLANIVVALGGRAAERILYNRANDDSSNYDSSVLFSNIPELKITTGASNDLKQAENLARTYINNFGINDKLGIRDTSSGDKPFLGREMASSKQISESSRERIDSEIERIIDFCYNRAVNILVYNKQNLHDISQLLLEQVTIGPNELSKFNIKFKHS